jgi:hypothetical protein
MKYQNQDMTTCLVICRIAYAACLLTNSTNTISIAIITDYYSKLGRCTYPRTGYQLFRPRRLVVIDTLAWHTRRV